ncbi:hypothetical protein C4572_03585 [Candidatus Parcubacteria bacterium]|nr:MAG: hypothetical protein C4572_03585 [Candidatus Parcubacteria bacterium]
MNLLPEENKILYKREYFRRLIVTGGFFASVLLFSAALALIPVYFFITSYGATLKKEEAHFAERKDKIASLDLEADIKKINRRIKFIGSGETEKLSSLFGRVIEKRNSGMAITSLAFKQGEMESPGKMTIMGHAARREQLISFENHLKREFGDQKVVSPISNLTKDKDLDFVIFLNLPK